MDTRAAACWLKHDSHQRNRRHTQLSRQHFSGGGSRSSTNIKANGGSGGAGFGGGFMSGGLAGVINRNITNSAVKTATTSSESKPSGSMGGLGAVVQGVSGGVGGKLYSSSVSKGGYLPITSSAPVATGSIAAQGTILEKRRRRRCPLHGLCRFGRRCRTYSYLFQRGNRWRQNYRYRNFRGTSGRDCFRNVSYCPICRTRSAHTTVHAADGTSWYKQYTVDTVDKSPYLAPDGSIAYNESIVKKLPPTPRRKDKI